MEFMITTVLADVLPQEIVFNFEQMKAEVTESLKKYENLVVTEDAIKDAKDDRAKLRALKDAIDAKRKLVKKEFLVPLDNFEAKVKDILSLLDKPILAIDAQIKTFEQATKDSKLAEIKKFFTDNIGDLAEIVPFDKVYSDKWLNVGTTMVSIQKEITDLLFRVKGEWKTISSMDMTYMTQMKDAYLKNFNIGEAINENSRLVEQDKKMKEYDKKRLEEAESQKAEQPTPTPVASANPPQQANTPVQQAMDVASPESEQIDFRVWLNPKQKMALRDFLITNEIKYGVVPKGDK